MPPIRTPETEHTFLSAKASTGAGTALNVKDYRFLTVFVATDGSGAANLTLKCQGSVSETAPTWASAQSTTNRWDYIALTDLEDEAKVDGDTGFAVAGADDYRIFKIKTDGLVWINFNVTARAAGSVSVFGRPFTNL